MDLKLDMYNPIDTLISFKKFWGISKALDVFMTSSMSDFFVILQFLATASVTKFVETLDLNEFDINFDKIYHFAKFNA